MLLVDKYKPDDLSDVLGNETIIEALKDYGCEYPHLLLAGPPGCGKTTVAHILKKNFHCLELNSSDERGIETIRQKVKAFCEMKTSNKMVILDECDSMTSAAQGALRRVLEIFNTKFILICNDISQISEALQSRCAILKFERIPISKFIKRIKSICAHEEIDLTEKGYEALIIHSNGDYRNCLNSLEPLRYLNCQIDDEFLFAINGVPNNKILESLFDLTKNQADDEVIISHYEKLCLRKYNSSDLIAKLFRIAQEKDDYRMLKILSEYQYKSMNGMDSKLQFYWMLSEMKKNK